MYKKLLILLSAAVVSACSITQNIQSVEMSRGSEICIIENTGVRKGFLEEFKSVLSSKGIAYQVVSEGSVPASCEWTSTYMANWTWDLALYMSYAEIKVFHNGNLEGVAKYDSTRGGANLSKFIDAETKIQELVNELMQFKSVSLFGRVFG